MMAFGFMEILMLLVSGGSGNDLLDYLPTDAYWRAKGVTVSVERMAGELVAGEPAGIPGLIADLGDKEFKVREEATQKLRAIGSAALPALAKAAESDDPEVRTRAQGLLKATAGGARAGAVRRLMAIRTLGELKKPEGLAALRPMLASKAMFEADYAQAAIAAIEGKPHARPRPADAARWKDVCVLPAHCGIVAQSILKPGGPVDFAKALKDVGPMLPAGQDMTQVLDQLAQAILAVAERVGNFRVHGLTLGVAEDVGDRAGFAVIVVRGLYDSAAAKAALGELGLTTTKVDGMDVLRPEREMRLILCSDERLVFAGGPQEELIPLKEVVAAIQRDGDQAAFDAKMLGLVKSADQAAALWAVARMTDTYRQAPMLAAFDTATLVGKEAEEGALALALVAVGVDAAAVRAAADEMQKGVKKAAAEVAREAERMAVLKPIAEFINSIAIQTDGAKLTGTATLKGTSAAMMMPMFFMMRGGAAAPGRPIEAVPMPPDNGN